MNVLDKVYNLTVDIKNIDTKYNSYAKFFDDDRETSVIKVKILNNNSPIDLENCSVEAYFVLANNTYHNETCKIIDSSEGIVELQLCQKCLVKGENIVRLSILKDNEIANTPIITYEVRKGLYSDNPNFNDDPLTPILSQMLLDVKVTKANQIELQERYEKSLPKIEGKIKEVESLINRVDTAIASGTQDLEVKEARVDKNGKSYAKLGDRLNEVDSQLEHNTSMVNKIINNFDNIDLNINYNYNRILNGMDVNYNNGFKGIYEGEYILNNHRFKYSNKTPKTLNSTLSLEHGIKDSFIIKEDDIYYMFFTTFEESDGDIGYATSLDLKNWVYKGIVIRKEQACWSERLPIWAPYISPKQSDGYYYMFVSGASPYKSCIFKSKSLTSGWSYYDYVKNNVGGVINGIDVNITKIDDKYIMLIANNNETPSIEMYLSDDLTLNNWVYVKDVVTKTEDWEGAVVEAGQLLKINNNQYAIFYGGGGSQTSQHIGLAVSNTLFGDYKKVGLNGMLMLDLPIDYKCIIAHPNIFFENGIYYIYCTISNNANKNEIICYTTTNFKDITPLTYSEDVNCIEKGILYINPYNDLIVSNLVPNQINAHVNFNKNLRLGIIALGHFTSDNFIRFRVYDYICSINAKNEKLNLENDSDAFQTSFINVKLPTNDMANNGTLVAKLMISYKCSSSGGFNIAIQSNGVKKPIFDINLTQLGVSSWVNKTTNWEKWTPSDVDDIGITTRRLSSDGFYSLGENTTLHFAIEY